MSQRATGNPYAATIRAHSHSFSTDVRMSARRLPTSPSGSFRMCVVGVLPSGSSQRPRWRSSAVFSCAPAIDRRRSSSGACRPACGADVTSRSRRAMSASASAWPRMRSMSSGASSGGSICSAPTQSRPSVASSANADVPPVR
ncbi:hypothetical protein Y047_5125 [Burkholderia pseudomallei MSHR3016]|nr:hypothetical protein Y047_5125 [Burkholderia pseudomallei MSHR3016]KGX04894.1 hypothetical protein Y601_5637 [Burkholderia pseudomallei MSHR640]